MELSRFLTYVAVMAGVTYLVHMLPLAIFRNKVHSQFIQSFLYYIPYAVLGAMTFPAILYSTSALPSALAGLCVAVLLALFEKGLLVVALGACAAVFAAESLMRLLGLL